MTIVKKIFFLIYIFSSILFSQLTRPERSNYEETSRYQDVIDFISALKIDGSSMKLSWLGYSANGKRLPMIFYGDIPDIKPETIRKSGKLVVYIQGNIHAGEVEGKEAMLELLRELREGKHSEWRRRLILMIVPIFNADGNDNISLTNRPYQHGPIAGMGQRANTQGLDLNRDHMKLETPEVRAFVKMLNEYDPHVTIDLHTTNGSFHGYHITYSFGLNPVIDSTLDDFTRSVFFPKVEQKMRSQKWRVHRYGDYLDKTPAGKPGYFFWAHEPRYNSNYVGFRNRLAILSEAYSYITFKQRIAATKALVTNILDIANGNSLAIKEVLQRANESAMRLTQFDSLGVRAEVVESNPAQEIILAPAKVERNPYTGQPMYLMNEDSLRTIVTTEFYATLATRKAKVPTQYFIPDSLRGIVTLLSNHGIQCDTMKQSLRTKVQRFAIRENKEASREFQKHKMRLLEGEYETIELEMPAGTVIVRMNQPLSRLAFYLLEPESEDGVAAWNFVDRYMGEGKYYPITKSVE
ncbi:MAG: M14 family metallopeptidase [Ignavibacteriales bacterium]|nr:M14 family metallopeptidase [Ignavibacteriales bacterium]